MEPSTRSRYVRACLGAILVGALGLVVCAPALAVKHIGSMSFQPPGALGGSGPGGVNERWALVAESGADFQRINLTWRAVHAAGHQPSDFAGAAPDCATYGDELGLNWCAYDHYFGSSANAGVPVNPVLLGSPDEHADLPACARNEDGGIKACPPQDSSLDEWTAFAALAINRYGPDGDYWNQFPATAGGRFDVKVFELWNEPNLAGFWDGEDGDTSSDVDQYLRLLEATGDARDYVWGIAGKPRAMLAAPSWTRASPEATIWLELFAERAPVGSYDRISLHPYGDAVEVAVDKIEQVRATLPKMPMWLTEGGWGTGTYGGYHGDSALTVAQREERQRESLRRLLDELDRNHPYVTSYAWFKGVDFGFDPDSPAKYSRFGLYRGEDFSARPVLSLFRERAAAE